MEKAAEELGYHKSECRRARKLTGQKLIAVFCPTLTNPYYVMLLQGIEEIAKENGYTVFVCNTLRDLKTEESLSSDAAADPAHGNHLHPAIPAPVFSRRSWPCRKIFRWW